MDYLEGKFILFIFGLGIILFFGIVVLLNNGVCRIIEKITKKKCKGMIR